VKAANRHVQSVSLGNSPRFVTVVRVFHRDTCLNYWGALLKNPARSDAVRPPRLRGERENRENHFFQGSAGRRARSPLLRISPWDRALFLWVHRTTVL
jgi:hypothetical protein